VSPNALADQIIVVSTRITHTSLLEGKSPSSGKTVQADRKTIAVHEASICCSMFKQERNYMEDVMPIQRASVKEVRRECGKPCTVRIPNIHHLCGSRTPRESSGDVSFVHRVYRVNRPHGQGLIPNYPLYGEVTGSCFQGSRLRRFQ